MRTNGWKIAQLFSIVVLASTLLSGCESMWVRANKGFLERDLRMLIEKSKVRITTLDCRMLGTTRGAVGVFSATSEQVDVIVKGLALKEAIEGSEEEAFLEKILSSVHHRDLKELRSFSGDGVKRYCSKKRAEELVLGNGVSFEYFVLYFDPSTDSVCVLLAYAYG